jgi:lipooligosaccharide transport system permease protein
MTSRQAIGLVWLRYFAVFRKNLAYGVVTTFVEPILYLVSFGYGLGGMIGSITYRGSTLSYRAFVLAGLVGQSVLFTSFFDGAYGGFIRMYYQKVFQAIAVTPITLSEVLWGELMWCASRALLSASVVLLIGTCIGDFSALGALAVLPLIIIAGLLFGALGMFVAASAKTIESISYPQYLLIFPMFLFCGVFFPIANLPESLRWVVRLFPLTAFLELDRFCLFHLAHVQAGQMVNSLVVTDPWVLIGAPLVLIAWLSLLVPLARRAMMRRLLA